MDELHLPRVINAAGHMSALGGANSPPEVADAVTAAIRQAMTQPVEIARLKDRASVEIARATGAEAGAVTTGAAAGIALAVAACVAGTDPQAIAALPFWQPKRVVLQAGHDINFGAPVVQMVSMGGGAPGIAGSATGVTEEDVRAALPGSTALLYVQSHHVRATGCLPLEACIALAHEEGVPVIVDAAAEEDLRRYVAMGADLVIYSGGKALGGLSSSGIVAGRAGLIDAVRAQERGIGRPMKVAPEQIISVIVALRWYERAETADHEAILLALAAACSAIPGVDTAIVADRARPSLRRLQVRCPRAAEVVRAMREGDPPVFVRAHDAAAGFFELDVRNLVASEVDEVAAALRAAVDETPRSL